MKNKYQMSSCGKFKNPVIENLEPAIQDQNWKLVNVILASEARAELFKQTIIAFNKHIVKELRKQLPPKGWNK